MSRFFKVKNFDRFQHYKDRSPPWIKLYNELLDDYDFGCLQDASKMHLIAIWLLASRADNRLPYDPAWIAKRINATDAVNLDALVKAGFLIEIQEDTEMAQDASSPQAERLPRERDTNLPEKEKIDNLVLSLRARIFKSLGGPLGFFEEGEINNLTLAYPGVDFVERLPAFWRWGERLHKSPTDIKALFVRKLKEEVGATTLVGEKASKPDVAVSQQLATSRLAQRRTSNELR